MNLHNYFWYFQSAIPPRICDLIVQHGKSIKKEQAITGGYGRNRNFETQPLTKKEIKNCMCKIFYRLHLAKTSRKRRCS